MAQVEIYKLRKTAPAEIKKYNLFEFMSRGKAPDPAHYVKEWAGQMHGTLPMTIPGRLMLDPPADYYGGGIKNGDIAVVDGQPFYYDKLEGSRFIEMDAFDTAGIRQAVHVKYGWFVDIKDAEAVSDNFAFLCNEISVPCGYLGEQSSKGVYNDRRPFLPGNNSEDYLHFLHPQFLKGNEARDFISLLTELSDTEVQQWINISNYLRERTPISLQDLQDAREQFAPVLLLPEVLRPLYKYIPADADKSELAYLVDKIGSLDEEQRSIFNAVTHIGWQCGSVAEIINLTETLDCFEIHPAINESMYGEFRLEFDWDECADVIGRLEKSEDPTERAITKYISLLNRTADADVYGHHAAKEEGGIFTPHGLLTISGSGEPREVYRGIQDLPAEYRTPASTLETGRDTSAQTALSEQTAPDDKPSVLAEIAESREVTRNKVLEPRNNSQPKQEKNKSDPDL
jgi:hypothetical protein